MWLLRQRAMGWLALPFAQGSAMQNEIPSTSEDESDLQSMRARLALCAGLLPVWGRHLSTSRVQSEGAVTEMLQAFADIGPHINMAERQSQQINDALAQPIGGVTGLVQACEQVLQPVLQDAGLTVSSRSAIGQVLEMVRSAVGAMEQISKPFQHETQMVAEQVDRMYMGFQYQDRISQMLALIEGDIARLQEALSGGAARAPDLADWLLRLESQYAMTEQHQDHLARDMGVPASNGDNETTFF
jgi:ABC-type transporter Mla subunit MlaD